MPRLRRLVVALLFVCSGTFAASQGSPGTCPVDTSSPQNIKICSPRADDRVPARFTYSFSAYNAGAPIATIRISTSNNLFEFHPGTNQFARDLTLEYIPQYENYGILAQMWDANGLYYESYIYVWVRKTAGACPFPKGDRSLNVCEPAMTGSVTGPLKIVASAYSPWFISHVKVYVDGIERYFADDDEVYTYIPVAPGAHTVTVQAWDSQGVVLRDERVVNVVDRNATCSALTNPGVQLCLPEESSTVNASLRLSARTLAGSVPITYMRLYRGSDPVWEGEYNSIDTDVHYQLLGLPAGTATFGIVAWNQQGAAFVDTATATVQGFLSPPTCAIPDDRTVALCYPGPGDIVPQAATIAARARWDGKSISAIRVYVDYQNKYTEMFFRGDSIYARVTLTPGPHRIVIVAWTTDGDVLISSERFVTAR